MYLEVNGKGQQNLSHFERNLPKYLPVTSLSFAFLGTPALELNIFLSFLFEGTKGEELENPLKKCGEHDFPPLVPFPHLCTYWIFTPRPARGVVATPLRFFANSEKRRRAVPPKLT